ncbi:MAG: response regulator [Chthoniobacterales bacterium]
MRDPILEEAKILIIDDEPAVAEILREVLESAGYRKIEALAEPREASARFVAYEPDLVVLDWMMPQLPGAAVLQQLRSAVSAETYLPILVVTARLDSATKHQALASGATDFLTKPFDPDEIVLRAGHLLETRFLHRRLRDSERKLRTIVETTPAVVFIKDLNSRFVLINHRFQELFGYPVEEVIGRSNDFFMAPETAAQIQANDRRVFATRQAIEFEETVEINGEARTFLSIKAPLYSATGELSGLCGIATDITERKRAEEAARLAKEEAERASSAKSEFLSRMSHELRTPLNSILGFAQLFELEAQDPETRENVEQILKGGRQLLRLIDEVLDISRIEADRMTLTIEPVSVELSVNSALALLRPAAAARNVHLGRIQCDREVFADEQRLQQVLLNLISNAIKYNRQDGSVSFSCSETESNTLHLAVSDTGIGIAPADRERLFIPFERVGDPQKNEEGIGLGLAISKRLIGLMGGTMGVESELGAGTTFWIELPLVCPLVEPGDVAEIEDEKPAAGTGKTLLYIEDDLSNLLLIEQIMMLRPQVRMLTAQHAALGLELARKHLPDVILLDLHLPDINGDVVLAQLRADPITAHIPVVMISAVAVGAEIARLKDLGAHAYLTKPFDVRHLLSVLDDAFQQEPKTPSPG